MFLSSLSIAAKRLSAKIEGYNKELFIDTPTEPENLLEVASVGDIPLGKVFVRITSIEAAVQNVRDGKPSKAEGLPFVWPIEDGDYYLWDGHHRVVQQWIKDAPETLTLQVEQMSQYPYEKVPTTDKQFLLPLSIALSKVLARTYIPS